MRWLFVIVFTFYYLQATPPVPAAVNAASAAYVDLLLDLDELANADTAFQVSFRCFIDVVGIPRECVCVV